MRRPWRRTLVAVAALGALAMGTFAVVSVVIGQSDPPPRQEELVGPLERDDAKPRVSGKFGEITIYDTGQGAQYPCPEDFDLIGSYGTAKGTPLEVEPTYLPSNMVEYEKGGENACQGIIISAARTWLSTQYGGPEVRIRRFLRPEPWVDANGPAERISTAQVAGRTATVIRHVVKVGDQVRGNSGVFWAERQSNGLYVVTALYGEQITVEELIKVAEGLR